MKLRKLAFTIAVLAGGCEFHASCGAGKTYDVDKAEALVTKAVATQTGVEPKVSCPKKIEIEKGGRFDCDLTIDDVKGVATIEQTDDKLNVNVVAITGLLLTPKLEQIIAEKAAGQTGATVKVDCGPRVRQATPDSTFRCHATDQNGASIDVDVKVKDTAGNVDYHVVEGSLQPAPTPEAAPPPAAPPAAPPADDEPAPGAN